MTRVAWMPTACRRLAGDQSGAVVVLMAVAMVPLLALTGVAVDSARAYFVQSRLSRALDAAGLAGGQEYDDAARRDAAIRKYFDVNFPPGFLGARVTGLTWTMNDEAREITLTAAAALDTTIMRLVGKDRVDVAARAVIKQSGSGMELVLVMDNTGSMNDKPKGDSVKKINAMKSGAEELINVLYGKRETIDNVWVGLVPFVTTVNIDPSRTNWLTGYDAARYKDSPLRWKGCIEERVPRTSAPYNEPKAPVDANGVPIARDITDDPPTVERWRPYFYPSTSGAPKSGKDYYTENDWPTVTESATDNGDGNDYRGPNRSCPSPVTPMTASKSKVITAIRAMGAYRGSGTMNHVGLVWGWRMLSPRWRGQWGGEMNQENLPHEYDKTFNKKVVVILTDGDNRLNVHDNNDTDYTSYGRIAWGWTGTTSPTKADELLDTRLLHVCNAMKANNIIIYTITFSVGTGGTIWKLFDNCASKPSQHFDSRDSQSLRRAFQTIANELNYLRVAQ